MLKDILFYPLALLIIAAMIFGALSLGSHEALSLDDIRMQGFTVEGPDFETLTAAPGTNFDYIGPRENEGGFARLYTNLAREDAPPSQGIFAALNPIYEEAFAGHRLRLTITARASAQNGLSDFDMSYFTSSSGATGWKRKTLSSQWEDYVLEFSTLPLTSEPDLNYFSIWPGVTAEPLSMDVARMRIEIIDKL